MFGTKNAKIISFWSPDLHSVTCNISMNFNESVPSSRVSSCLSELYQSLANLIGWSDKVMLKGVNLEDKETITSATNMIKAVLDGVKVSFHL